MKTREQDGTVWSRVTWFARVGLAALALLLATAGAARADLPPPMSSRTISLPSGPAAMKGLGESFSPNASTGAGNFSVPLELPPGLGRPSLSLLYTHGHGRSELGASFNLPRLNVYRTRDKGNPNFDENDRFAVSGPDFNDELVPVNPEKGHYRLKNEGGFALFVRDAKNDAWTIRYPNGDQALLGGDPTARQSSVRGVFRWYVKTFTDVSGTAAEYDYVSDAGYVYLSAIRYRLKAVGYENRADFTYEFRPDPFTDYGYGSAVTCRERLVSVAMSSGCGSGCSRTVRTYRLGYTAATQSLLSSVTEAGEGGGVDVTMPQLVFTYVTASHSLGPTVAMSQDLPLDLVASGRAQFDDVNGDGLPDLLVGTALSYTYYENLTGADWSAATALSRSPDVSLDDASSGVVLADVNGDGFRDVLRASTSGYSYFPGGNILGGKFLAYLPPVPLAAPVGAPPWNAGGARLADLNSDGRTDVLRSSGVHSLVDLNLAGSGGERVQERQDADLPVDVANLFGDPSLQMLDFNGDGVQDFVINEISWATSSRLRVFYGLGGGQFAPFVTVAAPKGSPNDFLFGDINNDGYLDLVKYSGQQITYWLGAGDQRLTGPFGPSSAWSAPARSDALSVQLMDMDGSGTNDLVILTSANRVVYVSFFASPFVGLLSQVDNGMGLVTTITYRTSTQFAVDAKMAGTPWRTTLPRATAVVAGTTVTDSFDKLGLPADVKQTKYEYADGFYDGKEREFRGFGFTRVTNLGDVHDDTRVTETWMHLGVNLDTGADEEILKGAPYRMVVKDGAGNVYASEETHWTRQWLCAEDGAEFVDVLPKCATYPNRDLAKDSLVAFASKDWLLKGAWEKTTNQRYTLETYTYDGWGHVAEKAVYGEVTFPAPRAIGDPVDISTVNLFVGSDEVDSTTTYINDTGAWLLGLPAEIDSLDARSKAVLAAKQTFYDGAPFLGLPLGQASRGKVTRESSFLAQENRWIDTKRAALDSYDMVSESLDANGNHSTLTYDSETHSFVTGELVDVGTGQAILFGAKYDPALGVVVQSTDGNGNVTQYSYDGLGRLQSIVDPDSAASLPTLTIEYTFGTAASPVSTVVQHHLVDRAAQTYQTDWSYLDGAGQTRLTKTLTDRGDAYVASGFTVKGAGGGDVLHYEAFSSAAPGIEAPPATTPVEETFHDALGRATSVFPPSVDGLRTYKLTKYLPFEVDVFDEDDTTEGTWLYPAITRVDGQGRTSQTVRYSEALASDGTTTQRREHDWTYAYDALGNLVGWTDPNGNLRDYAYDSLSRLIELRDPNLGAIHYSHDDAGNVTSRVDALGQARSVVYGAGNRVQKVLVQHDAHGHPDYQYTYHYDASRADGPLPAGTNTVGRVSSIEWPTGTTDYSYDRLGRIVTQVDSLWDPGRSPFEAQQRDSFRIDHAYNAAGWATHVALPGGRGFAWTYGARGKVQVVSSDRAGAVMPIVTGVDYDLEGEARQTLAANGTSSCAWFDARSQLAAVASGPSTSVSCNADPSASLPGAFQQLAYTRGRSRMITRIDDRSSWGSLPKLDAEYTYDRLQQVTLARTALGTDTYSYDPIQNLIRHTSTDPGSQAVLGDLHYGEAGAGPNQVTSGGGATYAYDAAGNMTAYDGYALEFDGEGRLSVATKDGVSTIRHYYDAIGDRRLSVVERPGAPPEVHRFVSGGYQVRAGEEVWSVDAGRVGVEIHRPSGGAESVRYTYSDHLTGTSHVTDESGTLVGFQRFGIYGERTSRIGGAPLHGYAGALNEPDEGPGLLRFGARFYAPALGRWVSGDAFIGESPKNVVARPLESGLYGYVSNNPVNLVDPTGQYETKGHNKIFDASFGPGSTHPVSPQMLAGMKAGSAFVDRDQSAAGAFAHAMRAPYDTIGFSQQLARDWLNLSLDMADKFKKDGFSDEMVGRALGMGIHTLQDSTSPCHRNFAVWVDFLKTWYTPDHDGTYGPATANGGVERNIEPSHSGIEAFPAHPTAHELDRAVFLSQMHYDMWKNGERYDSFKPGTTLGYVGANEVLALPWNQLGFIDIGQVTLRQSFHLMHKDLGISEEGDGQKH